MDFMRILKGFVGSSGESQSLPNSRGLFSLTVSVACHCGLLLLSTLHELDDVGASAHGTAQAPRFRWKEVAANPLRTDMYTCTTKQSPRRGPCEARVSGGGTRACAATRPLCGSSEAGLSTGEASTSSRLSMCSAHLFAESVQTAFDRPLDFDSPNLPIWIVIFGRL